MTELADPQEVTEAKIEASGLARLAEWKTQLAALMVAPFIGLGFTFDFLLRAKDFPELASAMWGMVAFLVGLSLFFFSLLCSAILATVLGSYERDIQVSGWKRWLAKWLPRLLFTTAMVMLLAMGCLALLRAASGLGHFVTPYVDWLHTHAR